ncbi:MAG TPA: adenylate cyclase regulatory domain-containing protein, partial [Solirubrobacterales bacterium]|nr:adenylate cyclase regulatory domain-containing protein [Solirubrobacterales bacterium]
PDDYPSPDLRPFTAAEAAVRELPDFEAEGLLDGLEGHDRDARLKLLTELYMEDGVDLETLKEEAAANRLALLPADLVLGRSQDKYTAREIAELAGLTVNDFQNLMAAVGLPRPKPDERRFDDADLTAARRLRRFQEAGIPTENLMAVTRQVGSSAARIAQSHRDLVATDIIEPGSDEYEAAIQLRQASLQLLPLAEQAVDYALRSHFLDQLRNQAMAIGSPGLFDPSDSTEVSICFADLVGFTRLGERAELEKIGTVAKLLESVAIEVTNPEVRLVKTIGDAAMLVSEDGAALFDAALRFIEVGNEAGEDLPALRVGVARGEAIKQVGDWFGPPVNLASRITEAARPDSVLADKAAVDAAGEEDFRYSWVGQHRFKGLDRPVKLYRVRRK